MVNNNDQQQKEAKTKSAIQNVDSGPVSCSPHTRGLQELSSQQQHNHEEENEAMRKLVRSMSMSSEEYARHLIGGLLLEDDDSKEEEVLPTTARRPRAYTAVLRSKATEVAKKRIDSIPQCEVMPAPPAFFTPPSPGSEVAAMMSMITMEEAEEDDDEDAIPLSDKVKPNATKNAVLMASDHGQKSLFALFPPLPAATSTTTAATANSSISRSGKGKVNPQTPLSSSSASGDKQKASFADVARRNCHADTDKPGVGRAAVKANKGGSGATKGMVPNKPVVASKMAVTSPFQVPSSSTLGDSSTSSGSGGKSGVGADVCKEAKRPMKINGVDVSRLKFLKPSQQCFHWENPRHAKEKCHLWHPKGLCKFYPECHLTAVICGYGHPFCSEKYYCQCDPSKRSDQHNHMELPLYLKEAQAYLKQCNRKGGSKVKIEVPDGGSVGADAAASSRGGH